MRKENNKQILFAVHSYGKISIPYKEGTGKIKQKSQDLRPNGKGVTVMMNTTQKGKKLWWIIAAVVAVLAAAAVCIALLWKPAAPTQEPLEETKGAVELYWNIDGRSYTENSESGLTTREPDAQGVFTIRFVYNGQVVERQTTDAKQALSDIAAKKKTCFRGETGFCVLCAYFFSNSKRRRISLPVISAGWLLRLSRLALRFLAPARASAIHSRANLPS